MIFSKLNPKYTFYSKYYITVSNRNNFLICHQVSVPRLIPERKCRNVEKEICNTQMINPHDIKQPVFIKYCTRQEKVTKASYLPPPPANRYSSSPVQATYNSNSQPSRQSTFTPLPPSSNRIAKVKH